MIIESHNALESKNVRSDDVRCTIDLFIGPFFYYFVHDGKNLVFGVGAEKGDAGLFEVRKAFEDRRGGKMATRMEDAFVFVVAPGDGGEDVLFEN